MEALWREYAPWLVIYALASLPFVRPLLKGRSGGKAGLVTTTVSLIAMFSALTFADDRQTPDFGVSDKNFWVAFVAVASFVLWLIRVVVAVKEGSKPALPGSRWEAGQRTLRDLIRNRPSA